MSKASPIIVTAEELWKQTAVTMPPAPSPLLEHGMPIMALGSCFSDNIGTYLANRGFRIEVNPFGAVYNPISVSQVLDRLLCARPFEEHELIEYGGLWHSSMHHGKYSGPVPSDVLHHINTSYQNASTSLSECKYLLLTWGSAYAYFDKAIDQVVTNCHKRPETSFIRKRMKVEELVQAVEPILRKLLSLNPSMQIVSTISPIRHMRDGAHGNQISKATLMLMNEELSECLPRYHYFPAYELMMDQMRDYRFYADDLCHPAPKAIETIAHVFVRWAVANHSQDLAKQVEHLYKQWIHRPLQPKDSSATLHRIKLEQSVQELMNQHPMIDLSDWFLNLTL